MERWAIGGDVVLHAMLVGICGLEKGEKKLRELVDDGVERVNTGNVKATNSGGTHNAGCHNIEVVEADEALVGNVDGKPVGGKEIGTENGFRDVCYMKPLSEGV